MGGLKLRRSFLYVPGNEPERMAAAAGHDCDAVVIDLEDLVPPAQKDAARFVTAEALQRLDFAGRERGVCINPIDGPYGRGDLMAVAPCNLDWVVLPKVQEAAQVAAVAQMLQAAGSQAAIIPMIESPRGVLRAEEICAAPRVTAVLFGAADYALAANCGSDPMALMYARCQIVVAARAAGIDPIDSAFTESGDPHAALAAARLSVRLGFSGKQAIAAAQLAAIHTAFTLEPAMLARARAIVAAYEQAETAGRGTAIVEGEFIELPSVVRARRIIAQAEATDAE